MNLRECFKKGMLKKKKPDLRKSVKGMQMAEDKAERAKLLLKQNFLEEAFIVSYTSMFQSARALLFKDGIYEKSHYCTVLYLEKEYVKNRLLKANYLSWLDIFRRERHFTLYGLEKTGLSKADVEDAIEKAEKFLSAIKEIVNKKEE